MAIFTLSGRYMAEGGGDLKPPKAIGGEACVSPAAE
jgi:hypothetical protein